jgi:hypothetical protein
MRTRALVGIAVMCGAWALFATPGQAQSVPSSWTMSLTISTVLDPPQFPAGTNFADRSLTSALLTCYAVPKSAVGQQAQASDQVQASDAFAGITIPFAGATSSISFDLYANREATVGIVVEDATNVAYVDCYLNGFNRTFGMVDADATVIQGLLATPSVQRVIFTPESFDQSVTVAYDYAVVFPPPVPVAPPNFTG